MGSRDRISGLGLRVQRLGLGFRISGLRVCVALQVSLRNLRWVCL